MVKPSSPSPHQIEARCLLLAGQAHALFQQLTDHALVQWTGGRRQIQHARLQLIEATSTLACSDASSVSSALSQLEAAHAAGHRCLQALRKRPLGKLAIRRSAIRKYECLLEEFRSGLRGLKSWRSQREVALAQPFAAHSSPPRALAFADMAHRLVIVTSSQDFKAKSLSYAPHLICLPAEEYAPEPGDYVYWPYSAQPLLSPLDLFAIFVGLLVDPVDFIIASLGPASHPSLCRILSLRDNLIIQGETYTKLYRTGQVPVQASGRLQQIFCEKLSEEWHEIPPNTLLSQPLQRLKDGTLQGTGIGFKETNRLAEHVLLQPFLNSTNEGGFIFFIKGHEETSANAASSFALNLASKLPATLRLVVIEPCPRSAIPDSQHTELLRKGASIYRLPAGDLGGVYFRLLAQSHSPSHLLADCSEIPRSLAAAAPASRFTVLPPEGLQAGENPPWLNEPATPLKAALGSPAQTTAPIAPTGHAGLSIILSSNQNPNITALIAQRCLHAFLEPGDELVVLDRSMNGSAQKSMQAITAFSEGNASLPSLLLISAGGTTLTHARNIGASRASRPMLVFLDEDAVPLNKAFFDFHRHAFSGNPNLLLTASRVRSCSPHEADETLPVDQPLCHLKHVPGVGAWGDLPTACAGMRRNIVSDWMTEGFQETNPDPRLSYMELAHRLLPANAELASCLQASTTFDGEFATRITMREQVRRHAKAGMAAAVLSRQQPHLAPLLGATSILEALNLAPTGDGALRMDACLSVMEGFKSFGDLLEEEGTSPAQAHLCPAILKMAYLQSLMTGMSEPGQNSPAATRLVLNEFFRDTPDLLALCR